VLKGQENLSPPNAIEAGMRQARRWSSDVRLACQSRVYGDVEIERQMWSYADVQRAQLELFKQDKAEERAIAILFCDLRNFTRISTEQFPIDMAYMLNRFYTVMGESILMNNGIIYQYIGDEIVGIFGASGGSKEKVCLDAVRAAFGMRLALERLNHEELPSMDTHFSAGIGIHFGTAFVGHLGHPRFRQFSVIGDPVNAASRIQAYTRVAESDMLISGTVANALPRDTFRLGRTFEPELKGIPGTVELVELLGFKEHDVVLELQTTLELVLKDEEGFAERFYANLFRRDSSLKQLFHGDMRSQGRMMTHMLTGIVYGLSRPEFLRSGLYALGRNHLRYGVKPEHYPVAREVFLQTIVEELGVQCTDSAREAWAAALLMVTDAMQEGAEMASTEPAEIEAA